MRETLVPLNRSHNYLGVHQDDSSIAKVLEVLIFTLGDERIKKQKNFRD